MSNRPHTICHMITTLDGGLLVSRWSRHVDGSGHTRISAVYEKVASTLNGDAFIIGRSSMAEFDSVSVGEASLSELMTRPNFRSSAAKSMWAVVIDTSGKLRYESGYADENPIVAVLSERVSSEYLSYLREKGVSYVFAGPDGSDIEHAVQVLGSDFNVQRLLLEGGGVTNGHFLSNGLIDEISIVLYPGVDGHAGSPTIFDANVKPSDPVLTSTSLRHLSTETLDHGFVWLRYSVDETATPD